MRGVAELYDERKRQFNVTLTPTAIANLEKIALKIDVSRSEVIEKAARGEINLLEMIKPEKLIEEASEILLVERLS